MPDGSQRERPDAKPSRSEAARRADHAGISKLAEELVPALIAKLGSTNLGELEVREGDWHVRLRRPFGVGPGEGRRSGDRPSRAQPGHEGHGHGRGAVEGHRGAKDTTSSNGTGAGSRAGAAAPSTSGVATSPAVGIFQPGARAASGTRVRAGDSLGTVNVIGVPQDVPAPGDGIVGATLVESGTAVEYGQELIRIELATPAEAR